MNRIAIAKYAGGCYILPPFVCGMLCKADTTLVVAGGLLLPTGRHLSLRFLLRQRLSLHKAHHWCQQNLSVSDASSIAAKSRILDGLIKPHRVDYTKNSRRARSDKYRCKLSAQDVTFPDIFYFFQKNSKNKQEKRLFGVYILV